MTSPNASPVNISPEIATEGVTHLRPDETTPSSRGTVLPKKFKQLRWTIFLFFLTFVLSVLTFLYIYAALIAQHPSLGRLLFSPSRTIFVVGLLAQVMALLITQLFDNVFDILRWQLASRDGGVRTTTFMGLSGATSLPGLLMLLPVKGPHIFWCSQR